MTSIHTWSTTASENDDADSGINWLELQDPDTVNNSARAMMGRVAEWRNDISIARLSTGAADAYEVTVASTPASLIDGMMFAVRAHQTNVGASTLKINTFGAKPLRAKTATNLQPGDIQTGVPFLAMYNQTADEFLIVNSGFFANALFPSLVSNYALNALIPVGAVIGWPTSSVHAGWLEANGASLATADYPALFAKYGYTYGGSGASFNIPDYRGEFLRGWDHAKGSDPDRASRTTRGDGTTGDNVGTKQASGVESHAHAASTSTTVFVANAGDHVHQQVTDGFDQDVGSAVGPAVSGTTAGRGALPASANTLPSGAHGHSASASSSTTVSAAGGNESRPRNVNVMYIIFAKPAEALVEMQGLTGLPYVFDDGTTAVDPGSGRVAWNNAAVTSATAFYASETGPNSEPFAPILATWDDLGTSTKGYLYITKVGLPTTFAYFSIDSTETDNGTWKQWTVTGLASSGAFVDGDNLNVIFIPVGSGEQGIQGEPGTAGGAYYAFDTDTDTAADPGAGDIRLNNATLASVTSLGISYSSAETGNPDYEAFIKTWDDSTTLTNRGQVIIKKTSAPQNFSIYQITAAIVDGVTYGRFNVTHQSSNGSFSNTDDVTVEFVRTGDQGASGAGTGDLLAANNLNDLDDDAAARQNLGVEIGVDVQAYAANLTSWAALAPSEKENTLTVASQVEMEAGTETALRSMSPLRVAQAIAALGAGDAGSALPKNYMRNPGARVSQQNGTSTGTVSGYRPADQISIVHSQDGVLTSAQVATATPGGSTHRVQTTVTTADATLAAGQYAAIRLPLEGTHIADWLFGTASAKDLVLEFLVNWPAGTYAAVLQNAAANRSFVREFTVTGGEDNTDTVKTVTFPGDTSGTWPTTAVLGATLYLTYATGSTYQTTADAWQAGNYLGTASTTNGIGTVSDVFQTGDFGIYADPDATGIAPPFVLADYEEDLRKCQRHFNILEDRLVSTYAHSFVGYVTWFFPVEMRVAPSMTPVASTGATFDDINRNHANWYGATTGYAVIGAGSTADATM